MDVDQTLRKNSINYLTINELSMKLTNYMKFFLASLTLMVQGQSNFQKGMTLYQSKKLEEAVKSLKLIEKTSGDYGTAQYYLGRIAYG